MLSHLSLRDFALFEQLELELGEGFTAMTGETGAGKSIVLDAIGLLRGERAAANVVRTGADRALVQGLFSLVGTQRERVRHLLDEAGIDGLDDTVVVRRVVSRAGSNRVYVNDTLSTVALLQALVPPLLEIVGQHAAITLTRTETHRAWIDRFASHDALVGAMRTAHVEWNDAEAQLQELEAAKLQQAERLGLARYQRDDLAALAPRAGEYEALEGQLHRVRNRERVRATIEDARNALLDADTSATDLVGRAMDALQRSGDAGLAGLSERLEAAVYAIDDVARELVRFEDSVDGDVDIDELEARHQAIRSALRTYALTDDAALVEKLDALRQECATLENMDASMSDAKAAVATALRASRAAADRLDASRSQAARAFFDEAVAILKTLGIPHARLELLPPRTERTLSREGWLPVEIGFSANPGEPVQSMAKVASGGELSRLLLALKTSSLRDDPVGTYVFDEVDNGIGGEAAEVVASLLRALGEGRQVLCVTHLASIAGRAHAHLHVAKAIEEGRTRSVVRRLDSRERVEEVARMIGGADPGDAARAHAHRLIGGEHAGG